MREAGEGTNPPAACFLSTFSRHERVRVLVLGKPAPQWGALDLVPSFWT